MEAFIAYWDDEQMQVLAETMNQWSSVDGIEPVAVKCPEAKYELFRRITADNLAEEQFYLLIDLGTAPCENFDLAEIKTRLADEVGMVAFRDPDDPDDEDPYQDDLPTGVRVCQKGVIEKWPNKVTSSYDQEHYTAVLKTGKSILRLCDFHYQRLHVSA